MSLAKCRIRYQTGETDTFWYSNVSIKVDSKPRETKKQKEERKALESLYRRK